MQNVNDIVYTPPDVSKFILDRYDSLYNLSGSILDPCAGNGSFYDQYPSKCKKYWCEISKGVDFFQYKERHDWIISNPPYSIFREWLEHSFTLADNIVYLIPINKVVGSKTIMKSIKKYGGIVDIHTKWSGRDIGFPFGFPCGTVYFKKGWTDPGKLFLMD